MASGGAKAAAINVVRQLNDVRAEKPPNFNTILLHTSLIDSFCHSIELRLAMLIQGVVPSTVKLLSWLGTQPTRVAGVEDILCRCIDLSLYILQQVMTANGPTSMVIQAFDADILPAILKSACQMARLTNEISLRCSSILSNTLCKYLVFKSVVRSAAKALERVDRLNLDDSSGGPIWQAWVVFQTLARERIDILNSMDKGEGRMLKCYRANVCFYSYRCVLNLTPSGPCAVHYRT